MKYGNKAGDLTDGWPDEPGRTELEAFARDLQGKLPELPPDAIQRIGGRMHDEMALQRWRKRRRRFVVAGALAASLLLALGVWRALDSIENSQRDKQVAERVVSMVRDQYRVPVMNIPVTAAPDSISLLPVEDKKPIEKHAIPRNDDRPLVALENHRSLFANE